MAMWYTHSVWPSSRTRHRLHCWAIPSFTYLHIYLVLQVPTTVMATVDSSVGGKTGVNHPLGKNMIGAFYQPQCVLIDTETLNTLPDRELASGISEIIKYGLIRDAPLFQWLEQNMDRLLQRDAEVISKHHQPSCVNTLCLYSWSAHKRSFCFAGCCCTNCLLYISWQCLA